MKLIAESVQANICLTCSLLRMLGNKEMVYRHCISTCFTACHKTFQVQEDGLKLNGKHNLLVYAGDILGGKRRYYRKKHKILIIANKEIRLEVTADKTKYMVMCRDQNAG